MDRSKPDFHTIPGRMDKFDYFKYAYFILLFL
jgi:hypothetical protein